MNGFKILIIDESEIIRSFFADILKNSFRFEVFTVKDSINAIIKLKNENTIPNIIIMDYDSNFDDFLREKAIVKKSYIPVIVLISQITKSAILEINNSKQKYSEIKKIIAKPFSIDSVLKSIGEILSIMLEIDRTECNLEANFNENIITIENTKGFNNLKTDILKFKLKELKNIYDIFMPRVFIMLNDIKILDRDISKFNHFINKIIKSLEEDYSYLKNHSNLVRIYSNNELTYNFLKEIYSMPKNVYNSIEEAIDSLNDIQMGMYLKPDANKIKKAQFKDKYHSLDLRFEKEKIAKENNEKQEKNDKIIIAIVDDDKVTHAFIKGIIKGDKYIIKSFFNGKDFVDTLAKEIPNLIFLDMMMPIMNGMEVLSFMKNNNLLNKTEVVIFSANLSNEVINSLKYFNINNYMAKIVKNYPIIVDRINKILSDIETNGKIEHIENYKEDIKVAIVDDDFGIREYVKLIMTNNGLKPFLYENGKDFIRSLALNQPDIIYLDLFMPEMSGFDVIKWLNKNNYNIPIIVFSASSQKETIKELMEFGIKNFILKPPSNPDLLLSKAKELLGVNFKYNTN